LQKPVHHLLLVIRDEDRYYSTVILLRVMLLRYVTKKR